MTTDPRAGHGTPFGRGTLWALAAGVTAAWGAFAAVRELPWQSVVAAFLAAGVLAASLTLSTDAVASDQIDLWRAVRPGLLTGLVAVVAVGVGVTAGSVGVALLTLLLLARPGLAGRARHALARQRSRRSAGRKEQRDGGLATQPESALEQEHDDAWEHTVLGSLATDPEPARATPFPDAPLDNEPDWSPTLTVPGHLSDHDLCLAWESSGRALLRCASAVARLEVVRVRQACLDELERRQPEAIRAWVLGGSAGPDSSPARFLAG